MFKKISQKTTSLIIAIVFSLITTSLILCKYFFPEIKIYLYAIIGALISFIAAYVIIFYSLHYFILERIKPIYKTIESISPKKLSTYESADNVDIIADINNKVLKWAKNKTKEIIRLKESAKYRKEFLANVYHELKTPLFNLQGLTLTLIDGGVYDNEINLKYLVKSEKNINQLISIVKDIETISKLETGELKLKMEEFDIAEVINEILELYEIKATDKKIKLNFIRKTGHKYLVKADKKRIFEVISNLVINSINYGKEYGKTTVEIHNLNDKYLIEITDDGIGIDKKDQQRIFERFYRVDKSRSKKHGGTGLGLSIVKHVIEAHNETINLKSEINEGATFSFSINKSKNDRKI